MNKTIICMAILALMNADVFAADDKTQVDPKTVVSVEKPVEQAPTSAPSTTTTTTTTTSTKAAPSNKPIDCNYKIPADVKNLDTNIVLKWSTNAVQQAFDLDYNKIDEQLKQLKNCFTDQGWQGFNDALEKSGNLKAIKDQKLTMSNQVAGQATLQDQKDNQWKIEVPLQVLYQNDKEKVPQELIVNVLIGRKGSGELGILQMIASPKAPKAETPAKQ